MMPHVDDGTLHALIDGALRAESPERAVEAEAHLEACADCRARLDVAAGLRDEARRILDDIAVDATPAVADFADVRARAGRAGGGEGGGDDPAARDRRRGAGAARQLRWTRGLAWAATLVVALGTGYLIRDLGGPAVMDRDDAAEPARALSGATAGEAADRVDETAPADAVAPEARGAERAGARELRTRAANPMEDVVEEDAAVAAAPPPPPASAPTGVAGRNVEEASTQAAKVVAGDEREPGPLLEPMEGAAAGAPPVAAAGAADQVADMADRLAAQSVDIPGRQDGRWIAVEPAEAADALGGSLYVLPRASLVEVYRARDAETPEALTLQRLSSGVTVRVTQRAAGAGAVEADAAAVEAEGAVAEAGAAPRSAVANLPAASTVTVQKDGFILEITGSLPAELLVILGESAKPAG